MKLRITILCYMTITCCATLVGQRHIVSINSDWQFSKMGDTISVNLPHTYNNVDAFDDEPGYYRGPVNYFKFLHTADLDQEKEHFLRFGAVNQVADILVNGKLVGSHVGGYTSFTIDITDELTYGVDTLEVIVDNNHNENIPPLKGDFTFYGGIYRDVELITVDDSHFSFDYYGSDGVYIDPLRVEGNAARIGVRGYVENFDDKTQKVVVSIYDNNGKFFHKMSPPNYSESNGEWKLFFDLKDVKLWSIKNPYAYKFVAEIIDTKSNIVRDKISIPYGIRSFHFDPVKGFRLNGKYEKLIGVNRHQDRPNIGNALTIEHHIEDLDLIKEMGANFLRTAHYPQDKSITDYCDKYGILVSIEIPLDHQISLSEEFAEVCKEMTLEMIHQYYNHPSVIIWAYMNEMGLGKKIDRDSSEMWSVAALAKEIENLIRKEDPYRYTMIPNHGDFDIYHHFGLTEIPMLVGWNLYYGWYEPDFKGFGRFVDHAHKIIPHKPMLITEYGAGADPRITSNLPERFDFSLEWSYEFHKSHIEMIEQRDFIAASAVWNMFDFGSESRQDAVPHINNKGLCGFDRIPKPVYYLYQSHLRDDMERSNQESSINAPTKYDSYWSNNTQLFINMGTSFSFVPENVSSTWYPSESIPRSIMQIQGGNRYIVRDRGIGSDRAISLTDLDPVYQTQVQDLSNINFTSPNGSYRIVLHYSSLSTKQKHSQIVKINNSLPIAMIPSQPFQAYSITTITEVEDERITLDFVSDIGKTFINGIQIFKL